MRNRNMYKLLTTILSVIILTSCANSYTIEGSSNVSLLDGKMLYLKVLKDNDFKKIDSCEVVHGQFHFAGSVDSVRMANIFMDDESVMPLVLESGDIKIKIDNAQQLVSGTPLNDKLFKFFNKYTQLKNQQMDLIHQHDQAILDGEDMEAVAARLSPQADKLTLEEDDLVTKFVSDNFDNILGPSIFFMLTIGNQYPELTPWIEDIMSKATDKFKNNPYVKDYYEKAQENQQIMNGMKEVAVPQSEPTSPSLIQAPTPNQLATPSQQPK